MRVLLALGGNAMANDEGRVRVEDQQGAAVVAMRAVAELIGSGADVVLTHGNGPQVGNLLVKNEIAAQVVPPVPLDWCGVQTQATLGFTLMNALDNELASRGVARPTATVVTRTLVAADDPGLSHPTKPIGRYLPREQAQPLMEHGQVWEDRGVKGWRRVVASPEPLEILDAAAARCLVDARYVVVAAGGGGVPVIRADGELRGIEAVIDKDLAAALLAATVDAEVLVIATDVANAVLRFGRPDAEPLGRVPVSQMRDHLRGGHFGSGSMGPKVEAACRFVEQGGRHAAITELDQILDAVEGRVGTIVVPD